MSGKLYVTGTPIGNLNDFSPRAVETLRSVDFIAAEDTRVTLKLLNHFDIKKPMVSYHEHNLRERGEVIINRILLGENCAIVSDAGMPCVSDPGEDLVRLAAEKGVPTVVIPGPSAVISALCVSGLKTSRFAFEGFLSTSKQNRKTHLESVKDDPHTLIFYEAPHKLLNTLKDMEKTFGNRRIAIARELTKIHEEVIRTTLKDAISLYEEKTPKGEFVLIIEGAEAPKTAEISLEDAIKEAKDLVENGSRPTDAAKQIAAKYGFKKSEIYSGLLGD